MTMRSPAWQRGYDDFYNKVYPMNPYIELTDIDGFRQDEDDWNAGWETAYEEFYGPEDDRSWDFG